MSKEREYPLTVSRNNDFTSEELIEIYEIVLIALEHHPTFELVANEMDLSDEYLWNIEGKLQTIIN